MKKNYALVLGLLLLNITLIAQTQAPGLDILGYGYDVFGNYADQKSKKRYCLFKYDNYSATPIGVESYNVPQYVILENISDHVVKTVSGESVREYSRDLSKKAGMGVDAMFFSASISASYAKSESGSKRKFYYTYMDANTKWRISFDERNIDNLVNILDAQFKEDLMNMEPRKLFETYGTHFIASAYLGGRADYSSISEMSSSTSSRQIGLAVEAKYHAMSANTELNKSHSKTLSDSKTETKLHVTGGNSQYANNINDPESYRLWADGIEGKPVLCDFEPNSLKPIWIFCTDEDRRFQLESEFEKMCEENPLPKYVGNSSSASNIVSVFKANLVCDIEAGKISEAGTKLIVWDLHANNDAQLFYIEETQAANEYKIRTKGNTLLAPANAEESADIIIVNDNGQDEIIWLMENAGNKSVRFKNKKTGFYITVDGNNVEKGTRLMQASLSDGSGQRWLVLPKDLRLGNYKKVFDQKWSSGWTTTKIVDVKNTKFLFHNKKGNGTTRSSAIINNGSSIRLNMALDKKYTSGWTSFEPFIHGGKTYHLAHKSGSGLTHVNEYDYQGVPRKIHEEDWSSGWTNFEIIYVDNQPYFLHYKKSSGLARIGKLNPKPGAKVWETNWAKNLASFQYFRIANRDFIFVLSLEGKAWIFEISKSGDKLNLNQTWYTENWEANITSSLVMDYPTGPVLFLYKNQTGKNWKFALTADGKVGELLDDNTWSTGWTDFDYWEDDGRIYFLHHKESGLTRINEYSW